MPTNQQLAAIYNLVRAAEHQEWWLWTAQEAQDWFAERLRQRGFADDLIEPMALRCMQAMIGEHHV